ncbi:lateral flagellar system RNA polymerase sigma factor LafS [Vibrio parahaemolyticus]|nr:lateral flagellar system RNA polymerase sigma factor LafS [Vibrio parahaemolyticus]EJC6783884.1 lateral flagellar system RNA polymerase sigma factor LafS [Vibrio parahaemolyticus]EJC6811748.1 lateral flagellar system RNA polymerase sigma factor LafS [Vibrio parahaemolyticus]EJC6926282.1 lateral flagellar system RNA polymerase sigma factor LafS [Vibrio parahaemolyticus]EJC6940457.1 lateral flagellar system RNA polymerase sigma factor LafS [Vibrio parahaemolyticus]
MLDMNPQETYTAPEEVNTPSRPIDENALLQRHQVMVKRVVNQLRVHATSHCSIEDMQQIGLIALVEAGRRYGDIDDTHFPAFAVCRVRGAILDELRRLDWRSRKTRQQAHELNDVTRDLTRSLGRMPTDSEIIKALGTDEQDYYNRQNAALAGEMQSLDQLMENSTDSHFGGLYDGMEHEHIRRSLDSALGRLSKRDQLLLTLFYQHELNLHEIALVLDLTPPRICQLHKQALKQLNQLMSS